MAARTRLPVGYVFAPKREELVGHILAAKLSGKSLIADYPHILHVDLYGDHPTNIMRSTRNHRGIQKGEDDLSGYFFTSLKKSTENGTNICRSITDHGTWLEKAKTKKVWDESGINVIGKDKYYNFTPYVECENSPLNQDGWQMHEYSLVSNKDIVLCHITKKEKGRKIMSKKRSRKSIILDMEYKAGTSKRKQSSPAVCFPTVINPTPSYVSHQVNNHGLPQQYHPMPHGTEYNFDDALTQDPLNLISYDVEDEEDCFEASNPYVVEGGLCGEYDRMTSNMHASSSQSLNNNPVQHTATGHYSSSACMNIPTVGGRQCIVQGTSTGGQYASPEFKEDIMQVPQDYGRVYNNVQDQAFRMPQASQSNTFTFEGSSTSFDMLEIENCGMNGFIAELQAV